MSSDGSITHFFDLLRRGNRSGIAQLWDRFLPRMAGLARKALAGRQLRVIDPDDVLQSVFISFWKRAEQGQFTGAWNRNDLWNLLATMTTRKASNHARRENAERRGGGRIMDEGALELDGDANSLDQRLAVLPSQDFDLWSEELLQLLDEELQAIAVLRLMEYKNREISELMGFTERKVDRKLEKIRIIWGSRIFVD